MVLHPVSLIHNHVSPAYLINRDALWVRPRDSNMRYIHVQWKINKRPYCKLNTCGDTSLHSLSCFLREETLISREPLKHIFWAFLSSYLSPKLRLPELSKINPRSMGGHAGRSIRQKKRDMRCYALLIYFHLQPEIKSTRRRRWRIGWAVTCRHNRGCPRKSRVFFTCP